MNNIIKTIFFILIFVFIFCKVSDVFKAPTLELEYPTVFQEESNSLDAVYIGSSDCYAFWNPLIAWEKYGITVHPYAFSGHPLLITEYLIREVRKTQKDAVFIVNINTLGSTIFTDGIMHKALDHMPLSLNKLKLTKYMTDSRELSFGESLEFYFPIIEYHSRWKDFKWEYFTYKNTKLKGANTATNYLNESVDISSKYYLTKKTYEISDDLRQSLESLLNYCDEENIKIVFVIVPRTERDIETSESLNTVKKIISKRGYTVLDLRNKIDDIGIDLTTDYYDKKHTNIHGSIKFTDYMSKYLIENLNFENKSNNENYVSWDYAYSEYYNSISNYILDIELYSENRDYSLKAHLADEIKVSTKNNTTNITWDTIQGATKYAIYRRDEFASWQKIAVTSETTYLDTNIRARCTYTYTIVPYYEKEGKCYYGNYLYNGITIKT